MNGGGFSFRKLTDNDGMTLKKDMVYILEGFKLTKTVDFISKLHLLMLEKFLKISKNLRSFFLCLSQNYLILAPALAPLFLYFGSGSSPILALKKLQIFWFDNIKKLYYKSNIIRNISQLW